MLWFWRQGIHGESRNAPEGWQVDRHIDKVLMPFRLRSIVLWIVRRLLFATIIKIFTFLQALAVFWLFLIFFFSFNQHELDLSICLFIKKVVIASLISAPWACTQVNHNCQILSKFLTGTNSAMHILPRSNSAVQGVPALRVSTDCCARC